MKLSDATGVYIGSTPVSKLYVGMQEVWSSGGGLTENVRVLFVGDSTTVGVGAGSGGANDVNGSRRLAVPYKTTDYLNAAGVNSISNDICAENNNGSSFSEWNGYRDDITASSNLEISSRSPTAGGVGIRLSSVTGSSFSFSPDFDFDTVEIAYPRASAFGVLRMVVDGTETYTFDQSLAADDYFKTTVTGLSLGSHSLVFDASSGTAHGPFFVNCYDSNNPSVQCFNAGARNWTTTDWNGTASVAGPLNAISVIDPDITVIDLGINDYRQSGTTIAQCKANIQNIIDECVASGSQIILCMPHDINTYITETDSWSYSAVRAMYSELHSENAGSRLIDTGQVYFDAGLSGATNPATYDAMDALGYMNDSLHPRAAVYDAEGAAIASEISDILGL